VIDNGARALLPPLSGPLLRLYKRFGLSPNSVSFIGLGIAGLAALAVAGGGSLLAIALWWASRIADGTDGIYARETHQASDFGAYLDIVLDMLAYSGMILGFAYRMPEHQPQWLLVLLLYVLCITSALALGIQQERRGQPARDNRGLRLGAGLAEGGETGIAYTLFLLFPGWIDWLLSGWIAMLITTVVARTLLARQVLADPIPPEPTPAPTALEVESEPSQIDA